MKINLLYLLFILPYLGSAQSNQKLIESHLVKFKNAKTYTLSIAEKLPADRYDFKPVKEEMSFKEQLVHLSENI